jgi:hypothetical protein
MLVGAGSIFNVPFLTALIIQITWVLIYDQLDGIAGYAERGIKTLHF